MSQGNQPRRKPQGQGQSQGQGRRRPNKPKAIDIWHPVPQLPEPAPIRPATDPTAVLRSLGDPPLPGQGAVAEHYLAAVVERAAVLATALAASAGLLDMSRPED
jgi:hypothetical protein